MLIVPPGGELTLYCRIVDPSQNFQNVSRELTLMYEALGETPTITWTSSSSLSLTPFLGSFNETIGAWTTTVTPTVSLTQTTAVDETTTVIGGGFAEVTVVSAGVGVVGCLVSQSSFTLTTSRFYYENFGVTPNGTTMISANYQPTTIWFSQDTCSPNSAVMPLGVSSQIVGEQLGALLVVTDDAFGPFSQLKNLISTLLPSNETICFSGDCSSLTIWDAKIIPGGDLLILSSSGLIRGYIISSLSYQFSKVVVGVNFIDQGNFAPQNVSLFTSNVCPTTRGSPGEVYTYMSYMAEDGTSGVLYSQGPVSGGWDLLYNITTPGQYVRFIGATWLDDQNQHLLLCVNDSAIFTTVCSSGTIVSCEVGFVFSEESVVSAMVQHSSSSDVLVYGDGVWHNVMGSTVFHKIFELEGEYVTSLVTTSYGLGYAVLTNKNNIYYGKVSVGDAVAVPSPLTMGNSTLTSIIFDGIGQLFSLEMDIPQPLPEANFPVGLYANSEGELRDFTDGVIRKTLLAVSDSITSSDYAVQCPLAMKVVAPSEMEFHIMPPNASFGCVFNPSIVGRTVLASTGGSAAVYEVDSANQVALASVLNPFQSVVLPQPLYNSPVRLRLRTTVTPCPEVDIIANDWIPNYVGHTLRFRLGSIYLSSYVNSTNMVGILVGCNDSLSNGWVALLSGSEYIGLYGELLLDGIQGILGYSDGIEIGNDGTLSWYVPARDWSLYDLSSPTQYQIVAECSYILLQVGGIGSGTPDGSVWYLDVGETSIVQISVSPSSFGVQLLLTNPSVVNVDIVSQNVYLDGLDFKYITLTFAGTPAGGNCTVLARPIASSESVACAQPQASLRVVQGCDPTKALSFYYPFSFEPYILLDAMPIFDGFPNIVVLPVNYRPPSAFGSGIPTSNNIYNADPSKPRYFDVFKVSKTTGEYKQCKGKPNRASCRCTTTQLYSGLEKDSDCIQLVYSVPWRLIFLPQLAVVVGGNVLTTDLAYTVEELNGRTDYCFNTSDVDCTSPQSVASYVVQTAAYSPVGIHFSGAELFHFRLTMVSPSFCTLTTEFIVWANNPPLPQFMVWIVVSCTAIFIALLLFVGFLIYSYLYKSEQ